MSTVSEYLKEINFYFEMNNKIYHEYIGNGSNYLYASILYGYNKKIKELVIKLAPFLSHDNQCGCIELCHHLDVWFHLFDELDTGNFSSSDKFVFENKVKFPSEFICLLKNMEL